MIFCADTVTDSRNGFLSLIPKPYNSYGNGSAMRCSAAGFMAKSKEECVYLAEKTAECTHNHPEGIKGAVATSLAIFYLKQGKDKDFVRKNIFGFLLPGMVGFHH